MSDETVSNADLLKHILDLKVAIAEFHGANLPARVDKLEDAVHESDKRWSKLAGISAVAGALGGGFLGAMAKKLGLTP